MTDVGREALQAAHERIDPIEQGVFGVFSERDLAVLRELLSRFIDAFDKA
jgi:DNA-binding MarR family transcriptional regulator